MTFSVGRSKFLPELARCYAFAPSLVLVRVAEAELLSACHMEPPILDLCCGDGFFCSLICPDGAEAGCDFSVSALQRARDREQYRRIACADVSKGIPFRNESFQTVVSNSSLEHVANIDAALREIVRVLKPGGRLYTTFASNFAYRWWWSGQNAMRRYLSFQPVYNYFPFQEWRRRMETVGLRILSHQYYLSKTATGLLFFLDYHFSHVYMTPDRTLARFIVRAMRIIPPEVWARLWTKLFARVRIVAQGKGGGILIVAEHEGII